MTTHRRPLDALHQLMDSDPIETPVQPGAAAGDAANTAETVGTESTDDSLDEALSRVGLDALSPEAQRYLLALTADTASVEPSTRQKLVDAAARGIQHHRNDTSALPRLLFLQRRHLGAPLEEVAARVGASAAELDAVERGRARVESLSPAVVASWIDALEVGADQARVSLGRALELQRRDDVAVAAAAAAAPTGDDEFIEQVIALLEARQR